MEGYTPPPLMVGSPVYHRTRSDWGLGIIKSGPSETGDWSVIFWDAPIAAGIRPENLIHYGDLRHRTTAQAETAALRAEVERLEAEKTALLEVDRLAEIASAWHWWGALTCSDYEDKDDLFQDLDAARAKALEASRKPALTERQP